MGHLTQRKRNADTLIFLVVCFIIFLCLLKKCGALHVYIVLGTNNPEWHAKFMNELGIIGESDEQLKNMKICEVKSLIYLFKVVQKLPKMVIFLKLLQ